MKKILSSITVLALFLSSCARDLSSDVYSSDSTMSLTMEGEVIAVRSIIIKDTDRLSENTVGIVAGTLAGASLAAPSDSAPIMVGGAIIGGLVGAGVQNKLSQSKGYEYIVKVDASKLGDSYYEGSPMMRNAISAARTSGIITLVQNTKNPLSEGKKVYIIVSEKRARIIGR